MIAFADYQFYKEKYKGKMSENSFEENILPATQYIKYVTSGQADSYQGAEVKYATCEVADIYASLKPGQRKLSENNDGYSVTFASEGEAGETAEQLGDRKAYRAVRKWLLYTGLLNRKVGGGHANQFRHYPL